MLIDLSVKAIDLILLTFSSISLKILMDSLLVDRPINVTKFKLILKKKNSEINHIASQIGFHRIFLLFISLYYSSYLHHDCDFQNTGSNFFVTFLTVLFANRVFNFIRQ